MKTRIIVGAVLIVILGLLIAFGGYLSFAAFTFCAVVSVYEMQRALLSGGHRPYAWGAYACAGLLYTAYLLYGGPGMAVWYALCVMFTMSVRLWKKDLAMEDMICSLFLCIYPVLFYGILISVVAYPERNVGRTAMLLCFAGPQLGDMLAYFIGSALGKRKLCPDISPKKTVEGSIAGLVGGLLGGALTWALSLLWNPRVALPPLLILGLVCGALGQAGDLFASLVKRWTGVKDYGNLFPGHGGMLDRLDSVLFCAPVGLLYIALALRYV